MRKEANCMGHPAKTDPCRKVANYSRHLSKSAWRRATLKKYVFLRVLSKCSREAFLTLFHAKVDPLAVASRDFYVFSRAFLLRDAFIRNLSGKTANRRHADVQRNGAMSKLHAIWRNFAMPRCARQSRCSEDVQNMREITANSFRHPFATGTCFYSLAISHAICRTKRVFSKHVFHTNLPWDDFRMLYR